MRKLLFAGSVIAALVGPARVSSQVVVETYSLWDGNSSVELHGGPAEGEVHGIGQVFTAPAPSLNSWSFWLNPGSAPGLPFTGHVAEWTGSTVGAVLWSSASQAAPLTGGFSEFRFQTGGIPLLTGGQAYIFFLTADLVDAAYSLGFTHSAYTDGTMMFTGDPGGSDPWDQIVPGEYDFAFRAEFDRLPAETVPEPATMTLLATGLAGLAASRRRRGKA